MDYKTLIVKWNSPLMDALHIIDSGGAQIALVVDAKHHLVGTITDADIRAFLIHGNSLDTTLCQDAMHPTPVTLPKDTPDSECLTLMKRQHIRQVPLIDKHGCIVGLVVLEELLGERHLPNAVVIMAGGLGSRLGPLTKDCPKPLLPVGGKPLLESILERMIEQGFRRYFISVNYLADKIIDYFGDGSRWGVDIQYIREKKRLGTAGSLSLLPHREEHELIVANGDILTLLNFEKFLTYHKFNYACATMAVTEHKVQIPYGVVRFKKSNIISCIEEKPQYTNFINAGMYVLSPESLDYLPKDQYIDMPSLFSILQAKQKKTVAYPLRELWLDIGTPTDFALANQMCES